MTWWIWIISISIVGALVWGIVETFIKKDKK